MKSRFIPFLFLLSLSLPLPVRAGGIPVFDAANLQQSAISAVEAVNQTLKQIEQYALQLQQYEDMIKNSIAPAAYVWDQAQRTMNKIIALQNQVEFYMSQAGKCRYLSAEVRQRRRLSRQSLLPVRRRDGREQKGALGG